MLAVLLGWTKTLRQNMRPRGSPVVLPLLLLLSFCVLGCDCAVSSKARPVVLDEEGFEVYKDPIDGPAVKILKPGNAQLIVGDEAENPVVFEYEVKNFKLEQGKSEVWVYFLENTVQSGLHTYESIPFMAPQLKSTEEKASMSFPDLPFGLHYILVRLVLLPSEEVVAEDARYFELRFDNEFEPRERTISKEIVDASFANEKDWEASQDVDDFLSEYVDLHRRILDPSDASAPKRFILMDEMMGGLGNRLGSIVSGALFALLSNRALIVASDLPDYFQQGRPETKGIAWNYGSMQSARSVIHNAARDASGDELLFDDMYDLTEILACTDFVSRLSERTTFVIKTPHYFAPFLFVNPLYREKAHTLFGDDAAGIIHRFLFQLQPRLESKVESFRAQVAGRYLIGLQIRQDHSCDNMTFSNPQAERVRSKAFLTYEHERLFFTCALSAARDVSGYPKSVAYFIASDLPREMQEIAARHFGLENLVYSPVGTDPEKERDQMSSRAGVDFSGAVIDMWLLGECNELITTPASSFGWMGAARTSIHPLTVTKYGKCLRSITKQPFCHGWRLLEHCSCFDPRMYVPEHDMLCQDCISLLCPCGSLTCGSHTEPKSSLFPRGACRLSG